MPRGGVLLGDAPLAQACLEGVAAAAPSGKPSGVDHPVVRERAGWSAVFAGRGEEGGVHDRCGDSGVGGEVQGVAGVVVEPGDDLGGGAVGEAVVGDVGLPGLVGLVGLEAEVGGLRSLLRLRR